MQYEILKSAETDLDALTDFYETVLDFLVKNINYPKWTQGVYPCRETIATAISEGSQYMCLNEGKIVGAFVLNDNPQGDYSAGDWKVDLKGGEYLVIHTLAVLPTEYGKGIARRMVEFCVDSAKSAGYKAARVDVVPGNDPARKLYESAGFVFAGERDLKRGFEDIPTFLLFEKVMCGKV